MLDGDGVHRCELWLAWLVQLNKVAHAVKSKDQYYEH
jgi:hypothetical protein